MTQKNSSLNLFHCLIETSHSLSQSHYIALKVGQALVADEDLVKDISFSYTLSCVCLKKGLLKWIYSCSNNKMESEFTENQF